MIEFRSFAVNSELSIILIKIPENLMSVQENSQMLAYNKEDKTERLKLWRCTMHMMQKGELEKCKCKWRVISEIKKYTRSRVSRIWLFEPSSETH